LTQQNPDDKPAGHCERRAPVEVTPAMVAAGLGLLLEYDPGWEKPAVFLENVFKAMWAAKQ
jgi:hypothetical protein